MDEDNFRGLQQQIGAISARLDRLEGAGKAEPAAEPPPLHPEPAPTGWITDRVPEKEGVDEYVRIPLRVGGVSTVSQFSAVLPGQPWAPRHQPCPGPWDPTTLNRNGWIRSRLPTAGDAGPGRGLVCIPGDSSGQSWQHYTFVTPGQPWAPYGSIPGSYQP